jgi:hypothetical protein
MGRSDWCYRSISPILPSFSILKLACLSSGEKGIDCSQQSVLVSFGQLVDSIQPSRESAIGIGVVCFFDGFELLASCSKVGEMSKNAENSALLILSRFPD